MITVWLSAERAAPGPNSGTVRVLPIARVARGVAISAKSSVDQVAGTVGANIEDRRNGTGLYESAEQADRLAAARTAAHGIPFWINARTNVFLGGTGRIDHALDRSAVPASCRLECQYDLPWWRT
jgi:hypothetical protein